MSEPARPVILSVDDDPDVSRAVARDLRRRYAQSHRIVRAESGEAALEALRDLRLRGEQVAILLADQRMPGMSGLQFLELAMDLYPGAKRLMLTAYADTGAAIEAINVVDLDYYLTKPWDPPEERLYPVIDDMLAQWRRTDHRPVQRAAVIGTRWSPRCYEVRDFVARNQIAYRWFFADSEEGIALLQAADVPPDQLPVVITAEGNVLVTPTDAQLAAGVGLTTEPARDFYEVAVIGGGPAGLGSAVYAASEGLRTVVIEREAVGGQAGQSSRIENYLGFPDGVSGAQLADRARRQALKFGAEIISSRSVVALEHNGAHTIRFDDGSSVSAHCVVLATGVSYRQLAAPGVADFTGRGVYYGSALTEANECAGREIVIVGGANSAGQAAVHFSSRAATVTMLVRGSSLAESMSSYLIDQIERIDNIHVRVHSEVCSAAGDGHLEQLIVRDSQTGATESIDTQWLFIFIGASPRTDWLDSSVLRDEHGFVLTGPDLRVDELPDWPLERDPYHLEASVPGLFVAGDVRADSVKRVASAVGEGAMAVTLIHRYLAQQ